MLVRPLRLGRPLTRTSPNPNPNPNHNPNRRYVLSASDVPNMPIAAPKLVTLSYSKEKGMLAAGWNTRASAVAPQTSPARLDGGSSSTPRNSGGSSICTLVALSASKPIALTARTVSTSILWPSGEDEARSAKFADSDAQLSLATRCLAAQGQL